MADRTNKTWMRRGRGAALLLAGALATAGAMAGYITTNEAEMDGIFSQSGFGVNDIDIRFNSALSYVRADLAAFDYATDWGQLAGLAAPGATTISMFFVDSINGCGPFSGSFVGCADTPGPLMVLDSDWSGNPGYGGVLNAHELAHNLGLSHVNSAGNLMNSTISPGASFLSASQISSLLGSSLIQIDGTGQRFVSITPIALLATAVPEPGSWLLMALGLGALLLPPLRRRAKARG
jgi:hypothetical protein